MKLNKTESEIFDLIPRGNLDKIKELFNSDKEININVFDDYARETFLHSACFWEKLDIVKFLVEKGANLNMLKIGDKTPLHIACTFFNPEIVMYLVESGASLNIKDDEGKKPFFYAGVKETRDYIKHYIKTHKTLQYAIKKKLDFEMFGVVYKYAKINEMMSMSFLINNLKQKVKIC